MKLKRQSEDKQHRANMAREYKEDEINGKIGEYRQKILSKNLRILEMEEQRRSNLNAKRQNNELKKLEASEKYDREQEKLFEKQMKIINQIQKNQE